MSDERGFYHKYRTIRRSNGEELDPETTFTLVPSRDPHAKPAIEAYIASVEKDNPELAEDLRKQFLE